MKLVTILNLEEYQEEVKKMMHENQITIFSEIDMQGYYKASTSENQSNWFANDRIGINSKMNFAFLPMEIAKNILEAIRQYNTQHQLTNPIHAFMLNVEDAV